ncbi:MAG: hypothetical protein CFH10_01636, partial [Alphaproteobacteria bacterium MarineAlpha4_Bin2]
KADLAVEAALEAKALVDVKSSDGVTTSAAMKAIAAEASELAAATKLHAVTALNAALEAATALAGSPKASGARTEAQSAADAAASAAATAGGVAQADTVTLGVTDIFDDGDKYWIQVGGNMVSYAVDPDTMGKAIDEITLLDVRDAFIEVINKSAAAIDITASEGTTPGEIVLTSNFPGVGFVTDAGFQDTGAENLSAAVITTQSSASGSTEVAQVDNVAITSSGLSAGDKFFLTIGTTTIEYEASSADTLSSVRDSLVGLLNGNENTSALVVAEAGTGDGAITLTAASAGTGFTASGNTSNANENSNNSISVVTAIGNLEGSDELAAAALADITSQKAIATEQAAVALANSESAVISSDVNKFSTALIEATAQLEVIGLAGDVKEGADYTLTLTSGSNNITVNYEVAEGVATLAGLRNALAAKINATKVDDKLIAEASAGSEDGFIILTSADTGTSFEASLSVTNGGENTTAVALTASEAAAEAETAANSAKGEAVTAIGALEILYGLADGDKGLAAIESVQAKEALTISVASAQAANDIGEEVALASQTAFLDVAEGLFSQGLISSSPATAAEAYTAINEALDGFAANSSANDTAKKLASNANDYALSAQLTAEAAAQSFASANGSYSNAAAQLEVAGAGAAEFAEKRAAADAAAIKEAQESVLGAKTATLVSRDEAVDAASDAFANAQMAAKATLTAVAQAYAFERARAIEEGATEEVLAGVEAYIDGQRGAPPTDLSAVPGFMMPLYDLLQTVDSGDTNEAGEKTYLRTKVDEIIESGVGDVSAVLSSTVTKATAAIATTSQVVSVMLNSVTIEGDAISGSSVRTADVGETYAITIGGVGPIQVTLDADDVATAADAVEAGDFNAETAVIRDKLLAKIKTDSDAVSAEAGYFGNEIVLTIKDVGGDLVSIVDGGGVNTLSISDTGIESALRGFASSLGALSEVTGAIGSQSDGLVFDGDGNITGVMDDPKSAVGIAAKFSYQASQYSEAVATATATMEAAAAALKASTDEDEQSALRDTIKAAITEASSSASAAQALIDTAGGQAELARAQAIYSESSTAQASAGQSQFAQALSKAEQETALRKAQELADAMPEAILDDQYTTDGSQGAIEEDTSVVVDVLSNDLRADGDPLIGATLLSVGAPTSGEAVILKQKETLTLSGDGAGETYALTIEDIEISFTGRQGQSLGDIAAWIAGELIAGDKEGRFSETVVATADGAKIILEAAKAGSPFDVTVADDVSIELVTTVANGSVLYTPDANYNGKDSFTYTVANDAEVPAYSSASVNLDISAVNDGPTAVADFGTVVSTAGTTVAVISNDSDIDGDTLSISAVTFEGRTVDITEKTTVTGLQSDANYTGSALTVDPVGGTIKFNPDEDWYKQLAEGESKTPEISYTVSDPAGLTSTSTLTVNVVGINDAPEAISVDEAEALTIDNGEITVDEDGAGFSITYAGQEDGAAVAGDLSKLVNDPDSGAVLNFAIASGGEAENGSVTMLAQQETLTISGAGVGEKYTFSINGQQVSYEGLSAEETNTQDEDPEAVANKLVEKINTDPAFAAVIASSGDGATVLLTAASAGTPFSVAVPDGVNVDAVTTVANGEFSYVPATDFFGSDSFIYRVEDQSGLAVTKTVSIDIAPVNDAPDLLNETTALDGSWTLAKSDLAGIDSTKDVTSEQGSISKNADGSYTFNPSWTFSASELIGPSEGE